MLRHLYNSGKTEYIWGTATDFDKSPGLYGMQKDIVRRNAILTMKILWGLQRKVCIYIWQKRRSENIRMARVWFQLHQVAGSGRWWPICVPPLENCSHADQCMSLIIWSTEGHPCYSSLKGATITGFFALPFVLTLKPYHEHNIFPSGHATKIDLCIPVCTYSSM